MVPPPLLEVTMALLWIDGFDNYSNGTNNWYVVSPNSPIETVWGVTQPDRFKSETGRGGVPFGSLYGYSNGYYIFTPPLTTCTTTVLGIAVKLADPTYNNILFSLRNVDSGGTSGSNDSLEFRQTSNRITVSLYGATILTSSPNILQANTWHYVEAKVFSSYTANGYIIFKVDGNEIFNTSNIQTNVFTTHDAYTSIMLRAQWAMQWDDMYYLDTTGNTNNDFLGSVFVRTLYPNGDASGNWTANSGTDEYAMCNSTTFNTTKFISTNTSGNQQLFTYQDTANCTVYGVQVNTESKLTGNKMMGLKLVSQNGAGSVNTTATLRPSIHTIQANTEVYDVDPDGNPWSLATLNDVRYGVQVT